MNLFSRRQFLRGAAGTALAIPLLSTLGGGRAKAVPPSFPKRLVIFFTPHGMVHDQWIVNGTENDFSLSGILAPLEPYKKDLIVTHGIDLQSAEYGPGDSHQEGMSALLCGAGNLADPAGSGGKRADTSEPIGWGSSVSVDQWLAKQMGAMTKLPSLELGVLSTENVVSGRISYLDAGKPVPPVNDPALVYDRIFADLAFDPAGLAKIRRERKSVLDAARKQFDRVRMQVGKDDRDKLDAHADALRGIELRLDATGGVLGGVCSKPDRPSIDPLKLEILPDIGKLQMDLLVMALACDVTRIASIMWTHAVGSPPSPWLGIAEMHHTLSHTSDSDSTSQGKLVKLKTWFAQQFAYLIDAMRRVPEGSGTMLDNTVILWGSEISVGNSHSHKDMPFIFAGSCGGYFKTGRFVAYERDTVHDIGPSHNDMLVSLCNAMGHPEVTTFGNTKYCTGKPLPRLTG